MQSHKTLAAILGSQTIAYNVVIARAFNSPAAAIVLSQGLFWQTKSKYAKKVIMPDKKGIEREYFEKSATEWEEETGISPSTLLGARRILAEAGVLHERLKSIGSGVKMYCSFDIDAIILAVQNHHETGEKIVKKDGHKGKKMPSKQAKKQEENTFSENFVNGENRPFTKNTNSVNFVNAFSENFVNAPIILLETNIERENATEKTDFKVEIFEPVKAETVTVSVAAAGGENDLIDPVTENTKKAIQWAGQNWETVKNWFSVYKIKCPETVTEMMPEVMKFYSNQMRGKSDLHEIYRSPVQYFIVSFPYWLSCSKQFNRIESKPGIAQPQQPQASGENLTKKRVGTWAQR